MAFFNCSRVNNSVGLGVASLISFCVTRCGGVNDGVKLSVASLLGVALGEVVHSAVFVGDLNCYLMALLLWSKIQKIRRRKKLKVMTGDLKSVTVLQSCSGTVLQAWVVMVSYSV